ncbi:hypothetical protein [Paenibacillus sp. QZ-Y1]|uniref:hypothetical protein n=1 Tax=Paenibacillus sp. QZ-Y1 TaxID=3414511 RepID=UPI003F7A9551
MSTQWASTNSKKRKAKCNSKKKRLLKKTSVVRSGCIVFCGPRGFKGIREGEGELGATELLRYSQYGQYWAGSSVTLAVEVALNAGDVIGLFCASNGLTITLNLGSGATNGIFWYVNEIT